MADDADEIDARRQSSEIIAVAQQMKQQGMKGATKDIADENLEELKKEGGGGILSMCCGARASAEKLDALKQELDMDEHTISLEELKSRFGTTFDVEYADENDKANSKYVISNIVGLTKAQVAEKVNEFGLNMLTPPATKPEWVKFCEQMTGFFSLLLWFGAILCFIAYGLRKEIDNLYLGVVLALVVFLTGVFGYYQEGKSSNLMASFKKMMPSLTVVVRDQKEGALNAVNLVPGDIVCLKAGDKVPADLRIIQCSDDMEVDNASLTGESEPQKRGILGTDDNPLETRNLAFFGTQVPKGNMKGVVVATGDGTVMGRIAALASETGAEQTPINKEIHHFVVIVSSVAGVLGVSFFFIGLGLGTEIVTNLVFMIGIIVANVPEGLLATVTVCLTLTANRMAHNSVLVKNLEGVETLGSTTCICSDKTGTLTQNVMTVAAIVVDHKRYYTLVTATKDQRAEIKAATENPSQGLEDLLRCSVLCNKVVWDINSQWKRKPGTGTGADNPPVPDTTNPDAKVPFKSMDVLGDGSVQEKIYWRPIGDATESALAKYHQGTLGDIEQKRAEWGGVAPKKEIAFNSKNKYHVIVRPNTATGKGWIVTMKGAPERIIQRCDEITIDGKWIPFDDGQKAKVQALLESCSKDGLRVLGFCQCELGEGDYPQDYEFTTEPVNFPIGDDYTNLDEGKKSKKNARAEGKMKFLGLMAMIDPPRPQVAPAVAMCKTAGIRVIMVTGDHPITAKAIAKQVGIIWGDVARGGLTKGPATQDDYEEWNKENGLSEENPKKDGKIWFDPRLAPAIVVPGWEIVGEQPKEKWDDILGHTQIVFARTSPQQKLIIVENCQLRGEIVAVTGDGVNDAPALKKADIGVAMGIMGSDVSKNAADMILLDDNFASIVAGVQEGRLIFDNLKKSIAYTLSSNIPEIAPFLLFITVSLPLPLSTVLILCVDLGTDMVPAISMAWENAESDIMKRPPRDADADRLVTRKLVFFAYLQIGVIQALAGFFTWFVVMEDYGFAPHILPGLGRHDSWGKQVLYCRVSKDALAKNTVAGSRIFGDGAPRAVTTTHTGAQITGLGKPKTTGFVDGENFMFVGYDGKPCPESKYDATTAGFAYGYSDECPFFVGSTSTGLLEECAFALRNVGSDSSGTGTDLWANNLANESKWTELEKSSSVAGYESVMSMMDAPYTDPTSKKVVGPHATVDAARPTPFFPYIPWKARLSPFWSDHWLAVPYDANKDTYYGIGGKDLIQSVRTVFQADGVWRGEECEASNANSDSSKLTKAIVGDLAKGANTFMTNSKKTHTTMKVLAPDGKSMIDTTWNGYGNCKKANHEGAVTTSSYGGVKYKYSGPFRMNNKKYYEEQGLLGETKAEFTAAADAKLNSTYIVNIASRMVQKETLHHAQCAYFVCIVIVQWADLVICKTRMNSIYHQGMLNPAMNFGLIFETILAAFLCYTPGVTTALGTRQLRLWHWMPGCLFSIVIFLYDEIRKKCMRSTTTVTQNEVTGAVERNPGWMERNTYY
jgi:magnesium-transporting ATPase (P-type)